MFIVKPQTLEDYRQALFILSYYHVKVTIHSDGSNASSVEIVVTEDYGYAKDETMEKALDQLLLAGETFDNNFDTEDLGPCALCKTIGRPEDCGHITYTNYTSNQDPIKAAMKLVLERDTQALFDKLNGSIQEPVFYDFFEDEYHEEGEGPTYTIRKNTCYPNPDVPTKEQVEAGLPISKVKRFVEGVIEGSRISVEFVDLVGVCDPDPSRLTCTGCPERSTCKYVDDAYNTDGDCLMMK